MMPRLELHEISKSFPGVRALERVSLDVLPGEVHALLGENGAGKSTLGKIIAGVYARDEGWMTLDGAPVGDIDEVKAGRLGIGIVHQEGSLVRTLSIADNVFAGRQPTRSFGRIDERKMVARSRELLEQLGVDIDPRAKVSTLSSAQAQVVEIAKALSHHLRLLILDEPTAALTLTESERLFETLRRLKSNGVSIVYVSHRLAEIFMVCDRVSVLKDGQLTGTREVGATSTDELIRLMVGRDVALSRESEERAPGPDDSRSREPVGRTLRARGQPLGARWRDCLPVGTGRFRAIGSLRGDFRRSRQVGRRGQASRGPGSISRPS